MLEKHKIIAKEIINLAKKDGAEQVSLSLANSTSFQIDVRENKIESLQESGSSGIHITVSKNKRRSTVSSNDLRIDTLAPLIRSTLESLPFMGEDLFYSLPDPKLQGCSKEDLEFLDPGFGKINTNKKVSIPFDLEKLTYGIDNRLRTEQSFYSDSISHIVHADSNGFLEGETKTLYSLGISMVADDNSSFTEETNNTKNIARKQTDGWYSTARFYKNLSPTNDIVDRACHRTLRKLGANIYYGYNNHLIIEGNNELIGSQVIAKDIRCGAALIVAGLNAKGTTIINNAKQINRGYENINTKLNLLGCDVALIPNSSDC